MTIEITRILSNQEYQDLVEFGRKTEGYYSNDRRLFTPGMAWYEPWYYDAWDERVGQHVMIPKANKGRLGFLSVHYWNDWADKRPPICVVCPNGELWEIDRKSSNGDGWKVTGDLPKITCSPSIVVHGYHGWLNDGKFSADVDGRPPNGIPRS